MATLQDIMETVHHQGTSNELRKSNCGKQPHRLHVNHPFTEDKIKTYCSAAHLIQKNKYSHVSNIYSQNEYSRLNINFFIKDHQNARKMHFITYAYIQLKPSNLKCATFA